jgi:hypothetical protein
MSAYPEDVMKAAREAVAETHIAADIPGMAGRFRAGDYDDTTYVEAAARAILAERERAAKIADACPDTHWGPTIAAAIRKGAAS